MTFFISKQDKLCVLHSFLNHNGICTLHILAKELEYCETLDIKKRKVRAIIPILEKELNKSVQVKIKRIRNEIYKLDFI